MLSLIVALNSEVNFSWDHYKLLTRIDLHSETGTMNNISIICEPLEIDWLVALCASIFHEDKWFAREVKTSKQIGDFSPARQLRAAELIM